LLLPGRSRKALRPRGRPKDIKGKFISFEGLGYREERQGKSRASSFYKSN
jgi:hypothetical protein